MRQYNCGGTLPTDTDQPMEAIMVKRNVKLVPSKKSEASDKTPAQAQEKKKQAPRPQHELKLSYTGASPVARGHGRKLSAVRTDLGALSVTERDQSFVADLRAKYQKNQFRRFDLDAGCVRRAIAHDFVKHVGGDLASRDAVFELTDKGFQAGAPKQ